MAARYYQKAIFLALIAWLIAGHPLLALASEVTGVLSSGSGAGPAEQGQIRFAVVEPSQYWMQEALPIIAKTVLVTIVILQIITLIVIEVIRKRKKRLSVRQHQAVM